MNSNTVLYKAKWWEKWMMDIIFFIIIKKKNITFSWEREVCLFFFSNLTVNSEMDLPAQSSRPWGQLPSPDSLYISLCTIPAPSISPCFPTQMISNSTCSTGQTSQNPPIQLKIHSQIYWKEHPQVSVSVRRWTSKQERAGRSWLPRKRSMDSRCPTEM